MSDPRLAATELLKLVLRARSILELHIPPDGISDFEAMNQMYAIFDGREFREAMAKAGAHVEPLVEVEYRGPAVAAPPPRKVGRRRQ